MGRGARKRYWRNMRVAAFVGLLISALIWWLVTLMYN